jgi:hypothetical protein
LESCGLRWTIEFVWRRLDDSNRAAWDRGRKLVCLTVRVNVRPRRDQAQMSQSHWVVCVRIALSPPLIPPWLQLHAAAQILPELALGIRLHGVARS